MKIIKYLIFCILFIGLSPVNTVFAQEKINWLSWEAAVEANKTQPRKIFVDVYTDWCGWCKKMDASTFVDPVIVKQLNKNYYAVKLNAEMKDSIPFQGHIFVNPNPKARGSVHTLAASLLDNKMSYPSFVLLNEEFSRLQIMPGYKDALAMEPIVTFYGENIHMEKSYEVFMQTFEPKVKK